MTAVGISRYQQATSEILGETTNYRGRLEISSSLELCETVVQLIDWGFCPAEFQKNKFLWFEAVNVWYLVTAALGSQRSKVILREY